MYKEARRISAAVKVEDNSSPADRWAELKLKAVRAEQPKGSASEEHPSTSGQGKQSGAGNQPSTTRNRQPTVKKYLDRITIAGLHNYLYATERYEKVTWRLTFLVAIVGTMFYLVPTVQQYLAFTTVLDIQHETVPNVRLPTVWVCSKALNVTYIGEGFKKYRQKLYSDRRIRLFAERFNRKGFRDHGSMESVYDRWNYTSMAFEKVPSVWNADSMSYEYSVDDTIDVLTRFAEGFVITSPTSDHFKDFGRLKETQYVNEFLYRTIEIMGSDWHGYKAFYEDGMLTCEPVMKNCTLNGIAFDCCSDNPTGNWVVDNKCYSLNVSRIASENELHQAAVTLSFETIFDSLISQEFNSPEFARRSFEGAEASGIRVSFGPRMPTMFEFDLQLAPASISTITVRGIRKTELTNCTKAYKFDPRLHLNSHPLLTEYFKEMTVTERYSVGACDIGKLLEAIYMQCGCIPYYDTIRPRNDSVICTPNHMYSCLYQALHDESPIVEDTGESVGAMGGGPTNVGEDLKRAAFRKLKAASALECLPLCESWAYDYTASSMPAEGSAGNVSRYFRSKVTIIFDPEYRVETEVYKMDYTALIASLGDGFGLILGFSAITLIQLPIWTIAAIVLRRKLNKISPLQRQAAVKGCHLKAKETAV